MKAVQKAIVFTALIMVLTSCNTFVPKPTSTPTLTATSLPTFTSTPEPTSTSTPTPIPPTKTPLPPTATASTSALSTPSGKPVAKWEGFPIMPGAIAGEGDSSGYTFTIKASIEDVQKFYQTQLVNLGWNVFASGQGTKDALLLIFMKGSNMVTISIISQPDGIVFVLLVK